MVINFGSQAFKTDRKRKYENLQLHLTYGAETMASATHSHSQGPKAEKAS